MKTDPILIISKKMLIKSFLLLPLKCLIVGTSGFGKTTLLYSLIRKEQGRPFHYLYIFSKSLEQEGYQILKREYEKLSTEEDEQIDYSFNRCEELISVDECEPNSLVVFDDCVNNQQQHIIKDCFVRGRHKNISCVYLTQSYTKVDRQLIRNDINFLCIFRQSPKYTKEIYIVHVGSGFT
jgi:GTPase SAR1 family protein